VKRYLLALVLALIVAVFAAAPASAQGPFRTEIEAEAAWAASGYPVCYPSGDCYYWDGYYWVWYPGYPY
jgi:hypothetical protein